ncbi:MAG: hypothetical protein JWM78_2286 [Verrucomicrobiaceae bacterium]|nr:hypothetical protein [Verrucomicrobiaceae bacterium]
MDGGYRSLNGLQFWFKASTSERHLELFAGLTSMELNFYLIFFLRHEIF